MQALQQIEALNAPQAATTPVAASTPAPAASTATPSVASISHPIYSAAALAKPTAPTAPTAPSTSSKTYKTDLATYNTNLAKYNTDLANYNSALADWKKKTTWAPPTPSAPTLTPSSSWQDYERYYDRMQGAPTVYASQAPTTQQTTTPAATPTTTTARALTPIEQVYGAGYYQNIDPNSPLGQVLAQGGWQMAHGGITDSLPYTQRRG